MSPTQLLMAAALVSGVEVEVGSLQGEPQVISRQHARTGASRAVILGTSVRGELVQLTATQVTMSVDGQTRQISLADVDSISNTAIEPGVADNTLSRVALRDGGQLAASELIDDSRTLTLTSPGLGSLSFPRSVVRSVRLQPDTGLESEWQELLQRTPRYDMLVVRKEKKISEEDSERVVQTLDHLQGIVSAIDEEFVRFQLDGNEVPVKRQNVFGVIYSQPRNAEPSSMTGGRRIETVSGEVLVAEAVTSDGETAFVKLPSGDRAEVPLAAVAAIAFSGGKSTPLSELEPRDVKYTPYFDFVHEYRKDSNQVGQPLSTGPFVFDRGLWIHSRTELTYRLSGEYKRFLAVAGIDSLVSERGDLELRILADGRPIFESTIRGADQPRVLDLSLENVRELKIVVDFGGGLDLSDHLCLGDAKLLR